MYAYLKTTLIHTTLFREGIVLSPVKICDEAFNATNEALGATSQDRFHS